MPEMCPNCYINLGVALNPPTDGGGIWTCPRCDAQFTMHLERKREFGRVISQTKVFTKVEGRG